MRTSFGHGPVPIERIDVSAYRFRPTPPSRTAPSSGIATTMVLVEAGEGGRTGLGYTYADTATARLIRDMLGRRGQGPRCDGGAGVVGDGRGDPQPRPTGHCSMAIAAVDTCLWDLKARLLDVPLVTLLGAAHDGAPVYGSGGFTSYSTAQLQNSLVGG